MKEIFILGGPNGAGKTTAARVLLREFLHENEFVNADEIARRISPEQPESRHSFPTGMQIADPAIWSKIEEETEWER